MKIANIEPHLISLKDQALEALGVDEATCAQIGLAAAPDPTMGDMGFPVFALARSLRKAPPMIAADVAKVLSERLADDPIVAEVNAVGPYVNFRFNVKALNAIVLTQALEEGAAFGQGSAKSPERWMIEYSAPNTNKPQHLGHVRNDLLGHTVANILEHAGHAVTRVNLINDRGIHICKSMLAYERFGQGETPESSGLKGDHLVGKYYVIFSQRLEQEYQAWSKTDAADARFALWQEGVAGQRAKKATDGDLERMRKLFTSDYKDAYFNEESELGAATKQLLLAWEAGDEQVRALWSRMNQWVFDGFDQTYEALGVRFDKVYYESQTYLLGRDIVLGALEDGLFERVEGGAIACSLDKIGLKGSPKILLRSDGTSVYMTQDLGTALSRFDEFKMDRMIYVVGDEQNYHFQVLFGVLGLLRPALEGKLYHLSYGMVELPEGKMKSREGNVVDADELVAGNIELAREQVIERFPEMVDQPQALEERARAIGMAGLKFFILDYNPKTTVLFDPSKSIDPQGRSGAYVLYAYARIHSIARELGGWPQLEAAARLEAMQALGTEPELGVIRQLQAWPHVVKFAAENLDPSKVTEGMFELARAFSTLYNDRDHMIKNIEGPRRAGLLLLCKAVVNALATGCKLIGVEPVERM